MADRRRIVLYLVIGAAIWIGATLIVASRYPAGSNALPIRLTLGIGGLAYFLGAMAMAARSRDSRPADIERIHRRLVLNDDPEALDAIRTDNLKTRRVYTGFGVVGLVIMFAFLITGSEDLAPYFIGALIVLAIAFFGYFMVAWMRMQRGADSYATTLGLRLMSTPSYLRVPDPAGGSLAGGMVGAMTYGGSRHGRQVLITQAVGAAVTVIGMDDDDDSEPVDTLSDPTLFAEVTGEGTDAWTNVVAERYGPGRVVVVRSGNGAGAYMLQDLLLAETLADRN